MQLCYQRLKNVFISVLSKDFFRTAILRYILCFCLSRLTLYGDIAPLGLSFVSATYIGSFDPWTGLIYVLGLISSGVGFSSYLRGLFSLFLFFIFAHFLYPRLKYKKRSMPAICLAASTVSCVITLFLGGITSFTLITSSVYIILSLLGSICFSLAVPHAFLPESLSLANGKNALCVFLLYSLLIASLCDFSLGPVCIGTTVCIFLCMFFAYKLSLSVCCVLFLYLGTIVAITFSEFSTIVSFFMLSGVVSCLFSRLGRIYIPLGFIFSTFVLSLYSKTPMPCINMYETTLASALFVFIPHSVFDRIAMHFTSDFIESPKKQVSDNLEALSDTFLSLSDVFLSLCQKKNTDNDANIFISRTADKVCNDCPKRNYCYKTNAESTYCVMTHLYDVLMQKGRIEPGDLPYDFSKGCHNRIKLTETMTQLYELYRVELLWASRVDEGRNALLNQMKSISDVLLRMSKTAPEPTFKDFSLEQAITGKLSRLGISIKNICAGFDRSGRVVITLSLISCDKKSLCTDYLEELLSQITKRKIVRYGLRNCKSCNLTFKEAASWNIDIAKADVARCGINGDSFCFARLLDGRVVIALSDGMGTGESAAQTSDAAVKLAVRLLSAGIDINSAVMLINSVLVNKSAEGPYATIDLVLIDEQTGMCEFVKNGAAAGFIKHENGEVEVIHTATLPAGLVECIDIIPQQKRLSNGDMLILLTDGVLDADSSVNKEERIKTLLSEFKGSDPGALASFLMNRTIADFHEKIKDDMTIITAKCIKEPILVNNVNRGRSNA